MNTDEVRGARYGKITLLVYLAFNGLLLLVGCVALWVFAARANGRGIPPNTTLGFRSQHTMASLRGWYVAQRVGFHFTAVAATIVTVVVFALVAVAFIRRSSPLWFLMVPVIGELAIAICFTIAGQRADSAAIAVEPAVSAALGFDGSQARSTDDLHKRRPRGVPTEDLKGEVPYLRSVLTLSARPALGGTS